MFCQAKRKILGKIKKYFKLDDSYMGKTRAEINSGVEEYKQNYIQEIINQSKKTCYLHGMEFEYNPRDSTYKILPLHRYRKFERELAKESKSHFFSVHYTYENMECVIKWYYERYKIRLKELYDQEHRQQIKKIFNYGLCVKD